MGPLVVTVGGSVVGKGCKEGVASESLVVPISTSPRRALLVLKLSRILAAQVEDEGLVATGEESASACLRVAR